MNNNDLALMKQALADRLLKAGNESATLSTRNDQTRQVWRITPEQTTRYRLASTIHYRDVGNPNWQYVCVLSFREALALMLVIQSDVAQWVRG